MADSLTTCMTYDVIATSDTVLDDTDAAPLPGRHQTP